MAYLIREINVPIEINYGVVNNNNLLRVLCNLPLTTENTEADYYEHLDNYLECVCEDDVADPGELLFIFNSLLDNFIEGEYEDFFRVGHDE